MEWFIAALLVPIIQATANLLQKIGLKERSTSVFTFLFTVLSFFMLLPFLPFVEFDWRVIVIFLNSILGSIGFYYSMKGIKELDLSEAGPIIANLSVVFTGVIETLIGQRFELIDLIGIGMILVGGYLLETNFRRTRFRVTKGFKYLVINAIIYGICVNIDRRIMLTGMSPFSFIFFITMFVSINLGILVLVKGKVSEVKTVWKRSSKLVLGIGALVVAYRVLQLYAVSLAPATFVIALKRLSAPISVILGGKILSEKYLRYRFLASIIMLFGALILIM